MPLLVSDFQYRCSGEKLLDRDKPKIEIGDFLGNLAEGSNSE